MASPGVARARCAEEGLIAIEEERRAEGGSEILDELEALLLRQLCIAQLETRQVDAAVRTARRLVATAELGEIAQHDAARAFAAAGLLDAAVEAQRLAARLAPPSRRSLHLWHLAVLHWVQGERAGALEALRRATRWAGRDRPLLRAQEAWLLALEGERFEGLRPALRALETSSAAGGYGRFVLGMGYRELGERDRARAHLSAFCDRHRDATALTALTLAAELRVARAALASLEVDAG